MKQLTSWMLALAVAITVAAVPVLAEEAADKPAAAPAQKDGATEAAGGCKADGSCCGAAACAHEAAGAGSAAPGEKAAGCPCQRNKQAKEKGAS